METTTDDILGHRVKLEQPAKGFRVAIDTVLLAAAVPAHAGQRVLDLGCGAGGAMLCLAARVPGVGVTGVEIQEELVVLCRKNIELNKMHDLKVVEGDIRIPRPYWPKAFDHAMMNPPYHDEATHDVSENPVKRAANSADERDLKKWIETAVASVNDGGSVTVIHRADRLEDILESIKRFFVHIRILPVLPKEGSDAKRIILRADRGGSGGILHCAPLVLHKPDGGYTIEAEAVLRHAAPLLLTPV